MKHPQKDSQSSLHTRLTVADADLGGDRRTAPGRPGRILELPSKERGWAEGPTGGEGAVHEPRSH